jgi:uptake hydrogenase large subunit
MKLDGILRFQVRWDGRRVIGVGVESARPLAASRALEGRTPEQAAERAPLMFSLCGRAQAAAALRACEAAEGIEPDAGAAHAREWVVAAEAAQESLWRLLLDWPEITGTEPLAQSLAAWRRRLGGLCAEMAARSGWKVPGARVEGSDAGLALAGQELVEFIERQLLGMRITDWLALNGMGEMQDWWRASGTGTARTVHALFAKEPGLGRSRVPLMSRAGPADIRTRIVKPLLADSDFAARPHWDGVPQETSALARNQDHPAVRQAVLAVGNGVAPRVLARLVELAQLARHLAGEPTGQRWVDGMPVERGLGAAWVETARGLLTHVVATRENVVRRYWILAPTEWNFHPEGPFARGLEGVEARDRADLETKIRLHALALDPCVGYQVDITDA